MQHKQRHIYIPTLLIIFLLIAIVLLWQFSEPEADAVFTSGEVMTLHGKVAENVTQGVDVDASSYLLLALDEGSVAKVEYHRGEADCENRVDGFSINKGQSIEVRGVATSQDTVSTCDSKGFYIR
ncbi:MAG: hypothetical protein H6760_00030 [Candidatus Nomurabacteria bacterium]|nr:MAG: hypothetical protein H6760_00030 [Candidatus Nomurabacteria bacterium]